jgi:hypothetical protein
MHTKAQLKSQSFEGNGEIVARAPFLRDKPQVSPCGRIVVAHLKGAISSAGPCKTFQLCSRVALEFLLCD